MEWLNYHHLLYFWTVAREGSISRACEKLLLAQPTISGQLRKLEKAVGSKLFIRSGRGLALTETGHVVYRYAEEIFSLGRELGQVLQGFPSGRPRRLMVGLADVLPKLIAYRILKPALELEEPVEIVCEEDKPERLLADLALHKLDIVLTDAPLGPDVRVLAFNHLLGECGTTVFGSPTLAAAHRARFPDSLAGAPFLLPTPNTALRRSLDLWFEAAGFRPHVRGTFGDSALIKTFGQAGAGLFAAPTAVEAEIRAQYGVEVVGRLDSVREPYFVISVERKLKHPAVLAISEAARRNLFAGDGLPTTADSAGDEPLRPTRLGTSTPEP